MRSAASGPTRSISRAACPDRGTRRGARGARAGAERDAARGGRAGLRAGRRRTCRSTGRPNRAERSRARGRRTCCARADGGRGPRASARARARGEARYPGAGRRGRAFLRRHLVARGARRRPAARISRGGAEPCARGLRARRRGDRAEPRLCRRDCARAMAAAGRCRVVHNGRSRLRRASRPSGVAVFDRRSALGRGQERRACSTARRRGSTLPVVAAGPVAGPNGARADLPHLRLLGTLRRDRRCGRGCSARRSSSRPRATSRSAWRCWKRRRPAARWCCPISPPFASCGTAPRCSSIRTTPRRWRATLSRGCCRPAARGRARTRAARAEPRGIRREAMIDGTLAASAMPPRATPRWRLTMRIVYFTHSLVSCWNHGNAHFLRGVLRELRRARPRGARFEPADGWSRAEPARRTTATRRSTHSRTLSRSCSRADYDPAFDLDRGCRRRRPGDRA